MFMYLVSDETIIKPEIEVDKKTEFPFTVKLNGVRHCLREEEFDVLTKQVTEAKKKFNEGEPK